MLSLTINLGQRSYPIYIGNNIIDQEKLIASYVDYFAIIITNNNIPSQYLNQLKYTLKLAQKKVSIIILPDGEKFKNWETLNSIFDQLLIKKANRKTTLLAFGGGVIGDITGFTAAIYMRGIPFIQIPTTLLAQVDSSVGGKTGINHSLGKNMIGSFYQPKAVFTDLCMLHTLPKREISAGIAEIIKIAIVADVTFFCWIEREIQNLLKINPVTLAKAIYSSCKLKADIITNDEYENGLRSTLNLGHTFGHAIEVGLGYGTWLHGEAVGCGIVVAAEISVRLGILSIGEANRIRNIIAAAGLPTRLPKLGEKDSYIELIKCDKKSTDKHLNLILIQSLGKAIIKNISKNELHKVLYNLLI